MTDALRWLDQHGSARLLALATALVIVLAPAAHAQSWPTQPVRIIVPFAPGGLNDVVARLVAPHLEKSLGQPVIVDNRPGASGIVGTSATAKAAPDGHTLLMVASSYTILPATQAKLPYDPERDLAPVGMVAKNSLLFLVNQKIAARTLPDFVALAKASPGKLNYASPGAATQTHLVIELFSRLAGIQLQHIPYRGGAPAIQAMLADDTQFTVISTLLSLPQIQAGSLRAIATGGLVREAQLPDVPTVAEQGFAGFEAVQWVGLLATAGTPEAVLTRLNAELNRALKDPDLIAKLAAQGQSPGGGSAADFARLIGSEIRSWTHVARAANIKPE
jgi:tripartite-type tricarboxylate transporter receptor subunit TctC